MEELVVEAGKFYKTRDGYKARIYALDGGFDKPIHGAIFVATRQAWEATDWTGEGRSIEACPCEYDLIAPWTDPPVVDWGRLPLHIVAVAKDGRGRKMGFTSFPGIHEGSRGWRYSSDAGYHQYIRLASDVFAFSGDWRDSLAVRPGWEGE